MFDIIHSEILTYILGIMVFGLTLLLFWIIYNSDKQLNVYLTKTKNLVDDHLSVLNQCREYKSQLDEVTKKYKNLEDSHEDLCCRLLQSSYMDTQKNESLGSTLAAHSAYIRQLNDFRKSIVKMVKTKDFKELEEVADRSDELLRQDLKKFHKMFDTMFLKAIPDFVEYVNAFLPEENQIIVKHEGRLNTPLRIFALMRMGITDSAKIAEILHCSVQTVYNNRFKYSNMAIIGKELFEVALVCNPWHDKNAKDADEDILDDNTSPADDKDEVNPDIFCQN